VSQAARNPLAQIRWDYLELRAEWRGWRERRALGREFREVERQVLAEHDAGEPQPAGEFCRAAGPTMQALATGGAAGLGFGR
jgi:hypothetical protein